MQDPCLERGSVLKKRNRVLIILFLVFVALLLATGLGGVNGFVSVQPLFLVFWIQGLIVAMLSSLLVAYKFIFKPWAKKMDEGNKT